MYLGQELYIMQGGRRKSLTVIYKIESNGSLSLYGVRAEGTAILARLWNQMHMQPLPSLEVSIGTYKDYYTKIPK